MAAAQNHFGSLIFCSRCSTLLDLPGDEDQLVCDACGQVEDATGACSPKLHRICQADLTSENSVRGQGYHDQVEPGCVPFLAATTEDQLGQEPRRR
jgi:DNA-directed RNA polymerase subunit M/transcription elongation factor TFIIS